MSLYFNGTAVGTLYFNGVKQDYLYFNGTKVFQAFGQTWSGNSTFLYYGLAYGYETSGKYIRITLGSSTPGAWISVDAAGVFSGNSGTADDWLDSSGSNLRARSVRSGVTYYGSWAAFTVGSGFSNGSRAIIDANTAQGFEQSGGLIRFRYDASIFGGVSYGAWISLT